MEKELREYLIYTGQVAFYEDMMKERRVIRPYKITSGKTQSRKTCIYYEHGCYNDRHVYSKFYSCWYFCCYNWLTFVNICFIIQSNETYDPSG